MGCTKSKNPVIHNPAIMSNNRQENKENYFGNDRPDEEAVELSPPKQQTEKKEDPGEEIDQVPAQPVIEAPTVKAEEPEKPSSQPIELPKDQPKPTFPNYEPNFDFNFLEENQGEVRQESEKKEDINDLIQDINDI